MQIHALGFAIVLTVAASVMAREYHVSPRGDDAHEGSDASMLRTISEASRRAQPGDVITVHEGIYRERINPPRGGTSDQQRIVYQAASGEKVVVKGSEVVKGWQKVQHDTWKVTLPNRFFGEFNPYRDVISGDWFEPKGRVHHTGAVYLNGHWLIEAARLEDVLAPAGNDPLWFTDDVGRESPPEQTTLWAQFPGVDPNAVDVEINVRQSVFYPDKPGMNYITVRGLTLEHAATPWAPPTAEQIGLIGTHWSKGWIIEDNTVRYSTCVGIALGKHGDEFDNTSQNSAEGYVKTIERGLANGWSKENIGHHVVRRNHVAHCEQAGIVGSLGPVFCTVTDNNIHDIHVRQLFTGAEMAGIKFHAAVDTLIARNHIYRTNRGIWLDWMAQGTRVTCNVLHDNGPSEDLFVEVNHGPFLVDHNLLLSGTSLLDMSEGGAYAHNLFTGRVVCHPEMGRETPHLHAHGTQVTALAFTRGGDNRFINNIFAGTSNLSVYDGTALPVQMSGNVFLQQAAPSKHESSPLVLQDFDPRIQLGEANDGTYVDLQLDSSWASLRTRDMVTTERLGKAVTPNLAFEQPDGSPYKLDTDYFGSPRNAVIHFPAPSNYPRADNTGSGSSTTSRSSSCSHHALG